MKRTPLKRRKRINPVNPAKAAERRDRRSAWREAVMLRDKDRCRLCGRKATDAHHILYRSQGGKDELGNGIALCRACHERVHAEGGRTWRPRLYELAAQGPSGPPAPPAG